MRRFSFKRGLRFLRQGGRAWVVVRRLTDGSIQLEADDGELWNAREAETLRLCQTGQLTIDLENSPVAFVVEHVAVLVAPTGTGFDAWAGPRGMVRTGWSA